MLVRWIKKLGQFHYEIHHQAGYKIPPADQPSRVPAVKDPPQVEKKFQLLVEQPTQNSCSDVFCKPKRKTSNASAEVARYKRSVSVGGTQEATCKEK